MNWTAPLLVLIAVWLVLNTIAGDLPGKVLSWAQPGAQDLAPTGRPDATTNPAGSAPIKPRSLW